MNKEGSHLREFGKFRLDARKRVLWFENSPVPLAMKEIEMLCVLTEHGGEVVTKNELLERVWNESFVEESNLSRHIYILRKTFKSLGVPDLIQTVPRAGYRFTGEVREVFDERQTGDDLIFERHSLSQTVIEEYIEADDRNENELTPVRSSLTESDRAGKNVRGHAVYFAACAALLVILFAGAYWLFSKSQMAAQRGTATREAPKTLAILPLQSLNTEDEAKVLGAGIAENLAARLGNLEQLIVRPLQSVRTVSDAEADPVEAGRKLKSDFVMTGSFQRVAGRIRVTVRLLSTADGAQIWAGSFDETETDIFKLQDSLSAQVSRSLVEKITPIEQQRLASRPTENVEAYKLYLKGRYLWNERSVESYFKAIELFRQAIALDPNFAHGYSGIADCYSLLEQRGGLPPEEAFPKAEEAARKALELDETLAEAHVSMALVKNLYRWDWVGTETHLKRAIELNPNYAPAHGLYGMSLLVLKRFDEAEANLRKAETLDPTSRSNGIYLAWKFYFNRQFDEAIEQSQKVLELDPGVTTPYMVLRAAYEQKGMYDKAVEAELKRMQHDPAAVNLLRTSFGEAGIKGFWQKQIEIFQKKSAAQTEVADYHVATRYALLDQKDAALREIEKGFAGRGSMWHLINIDPAFDSLRGDSRFEQLRKKLNLPQ
jgi:DNA-binding winged helix-turn-helix (wHTH) protein/TolB-like protein